MARHSRHALGIALLIVVGCSGNAAPLAPPSDVATITVESDRFVSLGSVRPRYTCDSVDLSPDLRWSGVPEGAQSIVILLDDPDAPGGSFTHWLVYDLPVSVQAMPEGRGGASAGLPSGGIQGQNGFGGRIGYGGPCPPRGETHDYFLHVYAVDILLDIGQRATSGEVLDAMEGHVVGHGSLTGTYRRTE